MEDLRSSQEDREENDHIYTYIYLGVSPKKVGAIVVVASILVLTSIIGLLVSLNSKGLKEGERFSQLLSKIIFQAHCIKFLLQSTAVNNWPLQLLSSGNQFACKQTKPNKYKAEMFGYTKL